jgi:hypothetical protein
MRVLASGLDAPWELTWAPDDHLWVTEKIGKRVDRIDPADGTRTTVLTLDGVSASGAQDGLLGLAFVGGAAFLAYTYDADPGPNEQLRGNSRIEPGLSSSDAPCRLGREGRWP